MTRQVVIFALSAMLAGVSAGAASAGPPPMAQDPLPPFTVMSSSGTAVASADLAPEPRWLLVWARPGAPATTKFLKAVTTWQLAPEAQRRLVIVFEGPPDRVAAYLASLGDVGAVGAGWYADRDGRAGIAIGVTGALGLRGIREGSVEWALEGVLNDPAAFESVVRTWIGEPLSGR